MLVSQKRTVLKLLYALETFFYVIVSILEHIVIKCKGLGCNKSV